MALPESGGLQPPGSYAYVHILYHQTGMGGGGRSSLFIDAAVVINLGEN